MPKESPNYICVVVMLIDFVFKKYENYCPQVFLKERKYNGKEKGV